MNEKFPEYKGLDLSEVNKEILKTWEENKTFEMSLKTREGHPSFVFYEGPPSANGMPGIHHVMGYAWSPCRTRCRKKIRNHQRGYR